MDAMRGLAPHAKIPVCALRDCNLVEWRGAAGARNLCGVQRAPGAGVDDPVLVKTHITGGRTDVLATEQDANDACEDRMDALFEFRTEPATCPTA
jgi:hypothetical protein